MGKKKTTTTQQSSNSGSTSGQFQNTNTFGFQNTPTTPELDAIKAWEPQTDPSIPYRFARMRQDLDANRNNVYGGYSSPAIAEAKRHSDLMNLSQQEGQATREGQSDVNKLNYEKLSGLANFTKPILTQIGSSGTTTGASSGMSSGTGTQTQSGGLLGDLLVGIASGASGNATLM
jgi:hypothetical protein